MAPPLHLPGRFLAAMQGGHYRLSASIPSVDMNTLRATLGARPLPLSVAGAVRGVLHCTGPLEFPVFSGTAIAVPPSQSQVLLEGQGCGEGQRAKTRGEGKRGKQREEGGRKEKANRERKRARQDEEIGQRTVTSTGLCCATTVP